VELLVPEGHRDGHPSHRAGYGNEGVTRPMGAGLQLRARRKDGSEFPADIALATLPGGVGDGPSVITTVRDVTDRWAAEHRLQALLDSAPDAMVIVDRDGRIDAVNRQTELLFGWTRGELVGQAVDSLIPQRFQAAHPGHRARYAAAPTTRPMGAGLELQAQRRDGTVFPAEISLSSLPDVRGGLQVTVAVRDVTRRAELESELRHSVQRADEANAAKSEFLSRMSHELRTPLNAVLGFAQILELDDLGHEQRDSVEQIMRAGRHLLELINEVLDISHIESGRLALVSEPVDVGDVVDEVVDLLQPLAREHQIAMARNEVRSGSPFVRSDRQRLKQVLLNIVSNAVKYNRPGGRVDIRTSDTNGSADVAGAPSVCITVTDTGRGIAPELLPRLFDPFDRLGAEQTDIEGSGMGLAVSRKLLEAMSGEIEVVSTPGRGTTVSVRLPSGEAARELSPAAG
jgi:PAS domain S-box-containing protein